TDGLDRADAVGVHAPVVVVAGVLDPPGEGARRRDAGTGRVRGGAVPVRRCGPLAAGVHDEVGVARRGPGETRVGEPAATPVAEVLDDGGQLLVGAGGPQVPGLDPVPTEAGEGDVVAVDERQVRVDRHGLDGEVVGAGLGERLRPERVEVVGLGDVRAVVGQAVGVDVEERHGSYLTAAARPDTPAGHAV